MNPEAITTCPYDKEGEAEAHDYDACGMCAIPDYACGHRYDPLGTTQDGTCIVVGKKEIATGFGEETGLARYELSCGHGRIDDDDMEFGLSGYCPECGALIVKKG